MKWLRECRAALAQPSLVRRLVSLQCVLLVSIWMAALLVALYQMRFGRSDLDVNLRFDTVLAVTEGLADRPEALATSLRRIDDFLRDAGDQAAQSDRTYHLLVRRGDQLLFASPGAPVALGARATDRIEDHDVDGQTWRARTRRSPQSDIQVTLAQRADLAGLGLGLVSAGALVLPLLLALPWAVVPAWISTHIAMRPLRRVVAEIGSRGPRHLSPLDSRPRHRELLGLVENVNQLLQEVRDANTREQLFIADAAHELRTPLAAMRLNAEALLERAPSPAQRELVAGIVRSATRAGRLASQLLSLMRSDCAAAQLRGDRVDLSQLVRRRVCVLDALAGAREVELRFESDRDVIVAGDPESLQSLVDNLLDNAIKFSPPGAAVTIRTVGERVCGWLIVEDHGPGVPADLRERIFDRFYRVPGQDSTGSGLGLAIVKSIVQRHCGSIDVTTTPGSGLTVTVMLPGVNEADAGQGSHPQPQEQLGQAI